MIAVFFASGGGSLIKPAIAQIKTLRTLAEENIEKARENLSSDTDIQNKMNGDEKVG